MHPAIEAHLGSRQVSRVIYGSIIGLALILGLETGPPETVAVIGSLIATAIAVALAELYSEIVGTETRTRHRIERGQLRHALDDMVAVAFGVAFPSVYFVLAAAGAIEQELAFDLAKWSGLGLIGTYGFAAARFAGATLTVAIVQALAVASVAGLLIAIKALVH